MTKLKLLIQINGLKRSGKDYTASLIKEIIGDKMGLISYATPIKEIIAATFDISIDDLEDFKNEDEGIYRRIPKMDGHIDEKISDFRKVLQRFGTEAMKIEFGEDVWAKRGLENSYKTGKEIVVIPDFRFVSENMVAKSASKLNGFKLITINVFNNDLPEADLHASERDLTDNNFKFDYMLDNTGQPTDLKMHIESIISQVTAGLNYKD